MAYFQTKNPNLGKFWRDLKWKMFVYFVAIWYILWPFGIVCGHLVYFVSILSILLPFGIFYGYLVDIFPRFGTLHQEKSGSPDSNTSNRL
jgi:hypothetical protein